MSVNDFAPLMKDEVTIAPFASQNSTGARTYGAPTTYKARVSYRPTNVRGADGAVIAARGVVWLMATAVVDQRDKLTLPDGTEEAPILAVDRPGGEGGGVHHVRVAFG